MKSATAGVKLVTRSHSGFELEKKTLEMYSSLTASDGTRVAAPGGGARRPRNSSGYDITCGVGSISGGRISWGGSCSCVVPGRVCVVPDGGLCAHASANIRLRMIATSGAAPSRDRSIIAEYS